MKTMRSILIVLAAFSLFGCETTGATQPAPTIQAPTLAMPSQIHPASLGNLPDGSALFPPEEFSDPAAVMAANAGQTVTLILCHNGCARCKKANFQIFQTDAFKTWAKAHRVYIVDIGHASVYLTALAAGAYYFPGVLNGTVAKDGKTIVRNGPPRSYPLDPRNDYQLTTLEAMVQ